MGYCGSLLLAYPISEIVSIAPNEIGMISFIAGVVNVLMSFLTIVWIKRQEKEAQEVDGKEGAANSVIFPIFVKVLWISVIANVYFGLIYITVPSEYGTKEEQLLPAFAYASLWSLQHAVIEGIALLLMQKGCGTFAEKRAGRLILCWTLLTFCAMSFVFYYNTSSFSVIIQILWDFILVIFYFFLWKAPLEHLFRRPAAIEYAKFWTLYRLSAVLVNILNGFPQTEDFSYCGYIVVRLLILSIFQPWVCYWTLLQDSQWWQGEDVQPISKLFLHFLSPFLTLIGYRWLWLKPDIDEEINRMNNKIKLTNFPSKPSNLKTLNLGVDFSLYSAQSLAQTMDDMRIKGQVRMLNFASIKIDFHQLLGSGSFSKVYTGYYRGEECAIKLIRTVDLTTDVIRRVAAEASILSSIRHNNIVNIIGVSVLPPSVCLILEKCSFGSLSDVIRGYGFDWSVVSRPPLVLSMLDILWLALGCAKGLAAVHSYGKFICHRDVKSFNFLVDKNFNVKIADLELGSFVNKVSNPPSAPPSNDSKNLCCSISKLLKFQGKEELDSKAISNRYDEEIVLLSPQEDSSSISTSHNLISSSNSSALSSAISSSIPIPSTSSSSAAPSPAVSLNNSISPLSSSLAHEQEQDTSLIRSVTQGTAIDDDDYDDFLSFDRRNTNEKLGQFSSSGSRYNTQNSNNPTATPSSPTPASRYNTHISNYNSTRSNFNEPFKEGVDVEGLIVNWLAPEVIETGKFLQASDVYSLGTVFWEILSRKAPYENYDQKTIREMVCSGYNLPIPPELEQSSFANIIKLCWSFSPNQRPTAEEVVARLEVLIQDYPFLHGGNQFNSYEEKELPQTKPLLDYYNKLYRKTNEKEDRSFFSPLFNHHLFSSHTPFNNNNRSNSGGGLPVTRDSSISSAASCVSVDLTVAEEKDPIKEKKHESISLVSKVKSLFSSPPPSPLPPSQTEFTSNIVSSAPTVATSVGAEDIENESKSASDRISSIESYRSNYSTLPNPIHFSISTSSSSSNVLSHDISAPLLAIKKKSYWSHLEKNNEAWCAVTVEPPHIILHGTSSFYSLLHIPSSFRPNEGEIIFGNSLISLQNIFFNEENHEVEEEEINNSLRKDKLKREIDYTSCYFSNNYVESSSHKESSHISSFKNMCKTSSNRVKESLMNYEQFHDVINFHLPSIKRRYGKEHDTESQRSSIDSHDPDLMLDKDGYNTSTSNISTSIATSSSRHPSTNSTSLKTNQFLNELKKEKLGYNKMCTIHGYPVYPPSNPIKYHTDSSQIHYQNQMLKSENLNNEIENEEKNNEDLKSEEEIERNTILNTKSSPSSNPSFSISPSNHASFKTSFYGESQNFFSSFAR